MQTLRRNVYAAIRVDARELRGRVIRNHAFDPARLQCLVQVESEIADIRTTVRVHHHVVGVIRRDAGQVRVHADAVGIDTQQVPVVHGDDQQLAVRQPSQSRRLVVEDSFRTDRAALVHRLHCVIVEVAEP